MLPKEKRITTRDQIKSVLRLGHRVRTITSLASVQMVPGETSKFGFICSKAVGNATERNFAKRRYRKAMQNLLQTSDLAGTWIIWRINQKAVSVGFETIQADVNETIRASRAAIRKRD
jgi:ribonuclease P protein component